MTEIKIEDLKKGDILQLKDSEDSPLYVRGEYSRELKKYSVSAYEDISKERFLKKGTIVYV